MRDYPLLNGFVQKRVIILGKELFRGMNMVHESSPLSEPLMATSNFTEVINDRSFSSNFKYLKIRKQKVFSLYFLKYSFGAYFKELVLH